MSDNSDHPVTLTEAAADRARRFLSREGGAGLRVGVRPNGCSGWAYVVELAAAVDDDDTVFEERGVRVVVDARSLPVIAGSRLDFVHSGLNANFEFDNPNVTDECGCGESFAVAANG